jgi:hypothetical protein
MNYSLNAWNNNNIIGSFFTGFDNHTDWLFYKKYKL